MRIGIDVAERWWEQVGESPRVRWEWINTERAEKAMACFFIRCSMFSPFDLPVADKCLLAYSELDVHLSWFYNNPFFAFFAPFCGELFFLVFLPAGSVAGSAFRLPRRPR